VRGAYNCTARKATAESALHKIKEGGAHKGLRHSKVLIKKGGGGSMRGGGVGGGGGGGGGAWAATGVVWARGAYNCTARKAIAESALD